MFQISLHRAFIVLAITCIFFCKIWADTTVSNWVDIPAGPANQVLVEFIETYDLDIIYPSKTLEGIYFEALSGHYSPLEAITRLVTKAGLEIYKDPSSGGLLVRTQSLNTDSESHDRTTQNVINMDEPNEKKSVISKNTDKPIKRGFFSFLLAALISNSPSIGSAQDSDAEILLLNPFEVSTSGSNSYIASDSLSATGFTMPLDRISVPITVISGDLIEDLNVISMHDLINYLPGTSARSLAVGGLSFNSRGFQAANLQEGFRIGNFYTSNANLDRLEIAKGPSGVLYGANSAGGAYNRILKAPVFGTSSASLKAGFGNYDYYNLSADFMQSVNENVAFRVVVDKLAKETDIDFSDQDQLTIAPSFKVKLFDGKLINTTKFEYYRFRNNAPEFLAQPGGLNYVKDLDDVAEARNIDKSLFTSRTDLDYTFNSVGPNSFSNGDFIFLVNETVFRVTDNIYLNLTVIDAETDYEYMRNGNQNRIYFRSNRRNPLDIFFLDSEDRQTDITGFRLQGFAEFDIGGWSLRSSLTFESTESLFKWQRYLYLQKDWVVPYNDVNDPIPPELIANRKSSAAGVILNNNVDSESDNVNLRFVTNIESPDGKFSALLGIGQQDTENTNRLSGEIVDFDDVSYQAGAVYRITDNIIPFINYSTSFTPNSSPGPPVGFNPNDPSTFFLITDPSAERPFLDPATGSNFDMGLKLDYFESRLRGYVTYFTAKRDGVARVQTIVDPDGGNISFLEAAGEEESKGIEYSITWTPSQGWEITLTGSHFDTEVVSANLDANGNPSGVVGNPVDDALEDSFLLSSTYRFSGDGLLNGLRVGGAFLWNDDYATSGSNLNQRTDEHTLLNLFAVKSFETNHGDLSLGVYVNNVFDRKGYIARQHAYGLPREARVVVGWEF